MSFKVLVLFVFVAKPLLIVLVRLSHVLCNVGLTTLDLMFLLIYDQV